MVLGHQPYCRVYSSNSHLETSRDFADSNDFDDFADFADFFVAFLIAATKVKLVPRHIGKMVSGS